MGNNSRMATAAVSISVLASVAIHQATASAQDNPELGIDPSVTEGDPPAVAEPPSQAEPSPTTAPAARSARRPVAQTGRGNGRDPRPATGPVGRRDHDRAVGRIGVGFFGVVQLPVLLPGQGADLMECVAARCDGESQVAAPSIGVRHWFNSKVGLQVALGFHLESGEIEVIPVGDPGGTQDALSTFGMALHGGLPLAIATSRHLVFQAVPFANLGFISGSITDPVSADADWDLSSTLLELGAKLGAEVHFGFIDMPLLALQGTLGLAVRHISASAERGTGATFGIQRTAIQTFVDQAPWDLFTGAITAIYYF